MRLYPMTLMMWLLAGGLVPFAASAEEYRGTMDQQMACTPDVWRLCSDQIPDVGRIVSCLRANTPQLSDGCRAVFDTSTRAEAPSRRRRAPGSGAMAPAEPQQSDDWFR